LPIENSFPPLMLTVAKPAPTCAAHNFFGPSFGQAVVQFVSVFNPSRFGPRNSAQSAPDAAIVSTQKFSNRTRRFTVDSTPDHFSLYRDTSAAEAEIAAPRT